MNIDQNHAMAFRLSLSALMAALGTVLMLSSNLIPAWGVTAGLALLLCADREAAFFYLFIGWYPILKPTLDRIPSGAVRILSKLLLFTLVFVLLFVLLTFVMGLEDMKSEMLLSIVVYAMLVATMLLYDRVYERMALIYERRLRDRLIRKPRSR